MVCIANYNDNNEVIGVTRADGVSGGLEFLAQCESLDMTITYKSQANLDDLALERTQAIFRNNRDALLKKADIEIFKLEDNNSDASAWRTYRKNLRDATTNWVMPTKP